MSSDKGLGRLVAPDSRDEAYPMRRAVRRRARPSRSILRRPGPVLDQGATSTCVGHGGRAWLDAGPRMTRGGPSAFELYDACITRDEWADNDVDPRREFGTSVRALMKYLRELGHLSSFVWAEDSLDVYSFLVERGPVVMGTDWLEGMDEPDGAGFMRLAGPLLGGHCWLIYGYSLPRRAFRYQNSHGLEHGQGGRGWILEADVDELLRRAGEAAGALEEAIRS